MFNFFYICKPLTFTLIPDDLVDDQEAEKPRWVEICEVKSNPNNLETVAEVLRLL
jgi:hypothetical protein